VIAGFQDLGEAVSNLRSTVQGSVDDLRSVVSSDSAKLLAEQVRLRETSGKNAAASLQALDAIHKKLSDR
jgi:predicted RecB family endonuclease